MIRVVLVDDHAVVRTGLAQLIAAAGDMEVVGHASDGSEALSVVKETAPDVVLMDLQMPGIDGVAATRALRAAGVESEVLVLTSYSDSDRIVAALDAGAVGYLLKDADPEDVLTGVRAVARGESPLHPRAARALLSARSAGTGVERQTDDVGLTTREQEVLKLMAEGRSNTAIAAALVVTDGAVEKHVSSIFTKLGLTPTDTDHRRVLAERRRKGTFRLRKASFKGSGLHPDLAGAPWEKIRDTIYQSRGA